LNIIHFPRESSAIPVPSFPRVSFRNARSITAPLILKRSRTFKCPSFLANP